jgi:hypothetical protein
VRRTRFGGITKTAVVSSLWDATTQCQVQNVSKGLVKTGFGAVCSIGAAIRGAKITGVSVKFAQIDAQKARKSPDSNSLPQT